MPGSSTTQDRKCARVDARSRFAFRCDNGVGVPIDSFAAQSLAYRRPCRRFAPSLTADDARLGADGLRYSVTGVDWRRHLLAGLPAHCHRNTDCIPRSATNPRLSSKPNSANSKPSERKQPRLCYSNPVSQPRGAVQYHVPVTSAPVLAARQRV